ncbi:MAG: hypothetical protein ACRDOC_11815 [Streptosporangiaceae bacterium]
MTRPLEWMKAVRDHPDRPSARQRDVLGMLVLRLDWKTGCGAVSIAQLAADADCEERIVRYATRWARTAGMLVRAKRGHRLGDGTTRATEWQLCLPSSTGIPVPVEKPSTGIPVPVEKPVSSGTDRHLNRHETASQPARIAPPSRPSPSRPRPSSARAGGRDAAELIILDAYPSATDDEIKFIIEDRIAHGARSPAAVLAHEIREGLLRLPCDRDGPGRHSNACRDGDPGQCGAHWCACRCHTEPAAGP